jgi:hypothetical protein
VRAHGTPPGPLKGARHRTDRAREGIGRSPGRADHEDPYPGRRSRPVAGVADHAGPGRQHPAVDPATGSGPRHHTGARPPAQASELVNRRLGFLVTGQPPGAAGQTHHRDDPAAARPDRQPPTQRIRRRPAHPRSTRPPTSCVTRSNAAQPSQALARTSHPLRQVGKPTSRPPSTWSKCSTGSALYPTATIYETEPQDPRVGEGETSPTSSRRSPTPPSPACRGYGADSGIEFGDGAQPAGPAGKKISRLSVEGASRGT